MPPQHFPVLIADRAKWSGCPTAIPWKAIARHEPTVKRNHDGQSLQRIADRGGLAPHEIRAAIAGKRPSEVPESDVVALIDYLDDLCRMHAAPSAAEELDDEVDLGAWSDRGADGALKPVEHHAAATRPGVPPIARLPGVPTQPPPEHPKPPLERLVPEAEQKRGVQTITVDVSAICARCGYHIESVAGSVACCCPPERPAEPAPPTVVAPVAAELEAEPTPETDEIGEALDLRVPAPGAPKPRGIKGALIKARIEIDELKAKLANAEGRIAAAIQARVAAENRAHDLVKAAGSTPAPSPTTPIVGPAAAHAQYREAMATVQEALRQTVIEREAFKRDLAAAAEERDVLAKRCEELVALTAALDADLEQLRRPRPAAPAPLPSTIAPGGVPIPRKLLAALLEARERYLREHAAWALIPAATGRGDERIAWNRVEASGKLINRCLRDLLVYAEHVAAIAPEPAPEHALLDPSPSLDPGQVAKAS